MTNNPDVQTCEVPPIPVRRAYPVDEARALIGGISRKSLYDLIRNGELRTVMIAGRRLVPDRAIDDLLTRAEAAPVAAEVVA